MGCCILRVRSGRMVRQGKRMSLETQVLKEVASTSQIKKSWYFLIDRSS